LKKLKESFFALDEVLAGIVREPPRRNESADDVKQADDISDSFQSQQSLPPTGSPQEIENQQRFQGWNYPTG